MPGTFMAALAIDQTWIMVELCIRINMILKYSFEAQPT